VLLWVGSGAVFIVVKDAQSTKDKQVDPKQTQCPSLPVACRSRRGPVGEESERARVAVINHRAGGWGPRYRNLIDALEAFVFRASAV
jgi:hypothetical protein